MQANLWIEFEERGLVNQNGVFFYMFLHVFKQVMVDPQSSPSVSMPVSIDFVMVIHDLDDLGMIWGCRLGAFIPFINQNDPRWGRKNPPGQAGDVAERSFFGQKMGNVMGKQYVINVISM